MPTSSAALLHAGFVVYFLLPGSILSGLLSAAFRRPLEGRGVAGSARISRFAKEAQDSVEVRCHHCGTAQKIPTEAFVNQNKIQVTCGSCGKEFPVTNPRVSTLKLETTRKKVQGVTDEVSPEGRALCLPKDHGLSLKIVQGPDRGGVFPILKPRVTIGRSNADINVDDPLVSRLHCAVEISDQDVLLRDLGSTNGTLLDKEPIKTAKLSGGGIFQIGGHIFQLIVTPKPS